MLTAKLKTELTPGTPFFKLVMVSALGLAVFLSAFLVVYNKHKSRQLFMSLQHLHQEVEALQVEWGQLLLEQSTWSSDARVEKIAREKLKMTLPEPNQVVVVD